MSIDDCKTCFSLAKHINKKLLETQSNKQFIEIGHRVDPDTGKRIVKKIPYSESEARFGDILDRACVENVFPHDCEFLVDEKMDEIRDWFKEKRETSFEDFFCLKIHECTAEVGANSEKGTASDQKVDPVVPLTEEYSGVVSSPLILIVPFLFFVLVFRFFMRHRKVHEKLQ